MGAVSSIAFLIPSVDRLGGAERQVLVNSLACADGESTDGAGEV